MILELENVTFRGPEGVRTWWEAVRTVFEGVHRSEAEALAALELR
jgi:hypothetical protein